MRSHRVAFRPSAERDLFRLYDHIAGESSVERAGDFIERSEEACLSLRTFPERGTRRDDIRPGLRVMGFERRATIVFRVRGGIVEIVRIFYAGQDYERVLRRPS